MGRSIGYLIEDATNLQLAVQTHKDEMLAKGFKEIRFKTMDDMLAAVVKTNSTQMAAHDNVAQNTESQNAAIAAGFAMITKIQNAARSAFGRNKTKQKEFRIGSKKSKSVGRLSELLDYLAGVCTKYHEVLIENGLTEDDFASISSVYANLVTADALQEHSKKLGNVATETRNDAAAALQEEMYRIRNFAKSAFAGNKAILEEFKPIKKGGRRGGGTNPTPPTQPPQS